MMNIIWVAWLSALISFFITFGPHVARKITSPEKTEEKLDTVIDGNLCQCLKWTV